MNGMQMQPSPHDAVGWFIVALGAAATLWSIAASIYWIVRPGETQPDHPKRMILRGDR